MRCRASLVTLATAALLASAAGATPLFLAGVGCNGPTVQDTSNFSATSSCSPPSSSVGELEVQEAASASSGPGVMRLDAQSSTFGFFVKQPTTVVRSAQAFAEWTYDDFVVLGPAGSTAPVLAALNLQISGLLSTLTSFFDLNGPLTSSSSSNADFFFQIEINGIDVGYGEIIRRQQNGVVTETVDGLFLSLYQGGAQVHAAVKSQFLMLPVNQALSVHVFAIAGARSAASVGGTPADANDRTDVASLGDADFSATVQFPTTGPVFDLPAGYTLHSVSANIVDNQFVPEPSTFALGAAASLAGLWARRRAH